ncbi:MAG: hypothetical protein R3343_05850 [Nitriliruptorales bacterium]|nr:hypothetical protein [Nitriliruptorales bacterium]
MVSEAERAAAAILAFAVVATMVAGLIWMPIVMPEETIPARLISVAFAIVGAIAVRKPEGRAMGWLMVAIGVSGIVLDTGYSYAELWAADPDRWVGGDWATVTSDVMGQVNSILMFLFLPVLFPTGRPAGRRWSIVLRAAVGLAVISCLGILFAPDNYLDQDELAVGANPLGLLDGDVVTPIIAVSSIALLVLAVAAIVGFIRRFLGASGLARLQMKWLALGLGATLAGFILILTVSGLSMLTGGRLDVPEPVIDALFGLSVMCVPVGAGIAVTRYRLYEIDRVVSRSATYATVVVVLAAIYVGAVLGLGAVGQAAFGDESNDLTVALSTLLVAAAFQPVRARVRGVIDRRFNRRRYDAGQEVERFGGRLRDSLALEDVVSETVGVAGRTVQPVGASLWLREGAAP